jgi:hypothetical protein
MSKATILKAGGILVAICSTAAWAFLPEAKILTPERAQWAFLIAVIGIAIGGVMWLSGKKAQTASLSKRHKLVTLAIIVAVMAIFTIIGLRNIGHPQENILTPEPPQEWQWSHPSPQEIWQEIEVVPPYRQDTIRQDYKGLSVRWGVTLWDATNSPDGVDIFAYPLSANSPAISFTIDASFYPKIKTMQRGQQFVVQGTIADIDTIRIKLDDCHLIFD